MKGQDVGRSVLLPLWLFLFVTVSTWAAAPQQRKGGGKGGFGEGGAGCATFMDAGNNIGSDGLGTYCNGTGGQVSVPFRFRIDLKKFNPDSREIVVDPICSGAVPCLDTPFQGQVVFQSAREYVGGIAESNLDFTTIPLGETREVSLSVHFKIDQRTTRNLSFGNDSDPDGSEFCPASSPAGPVEVTCNAVDPNTGNCVDWYIIGGTACLKDDKTWEVLDEDVLASFFIHLEVQ